MDRHALDGWHYLIARGLVTIVTADRDLRVVSVSGGAAAAIPIGASLCENVPALFGIDDALGELRAQSASGHTGVGRRITVASVAEMQASGPAERRDYTVVYDDASDRFVLMITPTFAYDEIDIEREQEDRRMQQLRARIASQAQAIEQANVALTRANRDLNNFTRLISHDLKAPMRAIRYSAEDLGVTFAESDDPAQLEAVTELRQQSVRLSRMVSDLLAYVRLEDKSTAAEMIDTRELIGSVARSLPRPPGLGLTIGGEWPRITTVGVLLDVVLRNLLDNAIKYHDQPTGTVTIHARRLSQHLEITFQDDGPGIPEAYRAAILQPFVTLGDDQGSPAHHGALEGAEQGSGLGLSMVHKVLTEAGGSLTITDRADGRRGACIVALWPLTIVAT